ncbi:putative taste receptor type 2 member 33 [Rhinoderma darwinii]|uniref:putative taste receptor type 2 member 33 n=1 Tax=Rhinoderma darwinii TaxID=43563 RepID=UPI003F6801E9
MLPAPELLHVVITIVVFLLGTAQNASILSIYFTDWRRKERFTSCDQIFLSTAPTNLILQWFSIFLCLGFYVFSQLPHIGMIYLYASVFFFCMSYFYFWNTSWLSIQYCLKRTNFSNSFLTWLKTRVSSSMTQVLLASCIWKTNSTSVAVNLHGLALNLLLGCVLPFIKTLLCIGISVMNLLKHVRRIKSKFSSSPHVNGHVRVVRTLIPHVVLNAALQPAITGRIVSSFNLTSFTSDKFLK